MSPPLGSFDLGRLRLTSGEGRRLELEVSLGRFEFGSEHYDSAPDPVGVVVDVSRMTGAGLALRLRFEAALVGPCMRCLGPAAPVYAVDVREINQPGGGEELQSPYLDEHDVLDLGAWARDSYVLALPQQVLCREDCAGLCPDCGADLNADPDHAHERPPDPRWAALRELKLD
jgi:uncharacterized protein